MQQNDHALVFLIDEGLATKILGTSSPKLPRIEVPSELIQDLVGCRVLIKFRIV